MFFSKEIEGLQDDGFEGSANEHRIFTRVFFGNDHVRTGKRCLVTGAINFENEYSRETDGSLCSNSENSVITSHVVSCNVKVGSRENSGPGYFSEGHGLLVRNEQDVNGKRIKLSVDELSSSRLCSGGKFNSSAPIKGVVTSIPQPTSQAVCRVLTCRLVESYGQGVTSSCYLLKRHTETITGTDVGSRDVSKSRFRGFDGSNMKEVDASRAIASPISQEISSATKLLHISPSATVANKSGSLQCAEETVEPSSTQELSRTKKSSNRDPMKDPRPLLRGHIQNLLRAAGWEIGRRKRGDKVNSEFIYLSPQGGRRARDFREAWNLCGQNLFGNRNIVAQEDGKHWTDMTDFWSDLSDTFMKIEEQLDTTGTAVLAHRWCLLDPFANMVFIDKNLVTLRGGKEVKVRRCVVIDTSAKDNAVLTLKKVDSIGNQPERHSADLLHDSSLGRESALPDSEGSFHVTVEVPMFTKNESLDHETLAQDIKSEKPETKKDDGQKSSITCLLKDDDLLSSATIKKQTFRSTSKKSSRKVKPYKSEARRKSKSRKHSCRLLPRSLGKRGKRMEGKWSISGVRTVLSWLIDTGVLSPNGVIQFRNTIDDTVVKDGLITRDGILCKCCSKVLSVSEFKIHAGFWENRPCLNLVMESGKPFSICQLEAWSAEYKARKTAKRAVQVDDRDQNDDSCGLCGDGGDLICCDNCPSTFHLACLYAQDLPEGSWYCSNCVCWICGEVVNGKEAVKSPEAIKCSQCEHKYHKACLKEKDMYREIASDNWFCGENCHEVYVGLESRIALVNPISDGSSWTLLKCIHGDKRVHSAQSFVTLKAECNSKLAVALTVMEECFLPMVDPRTGIDMIPHLLYNWRSEFVRLNYNGFYTAVLERDDVLISVASIRIHGVTVAEMPLIATCSKYRRQGMCRRLLNSIEEMLKSFKVEKLVITAIPSLVETWIAGFGFEPLEDNERRSLRNINFMVMPGTVWLKKPIYENRATDQPESAHTSSKNRDDPTETGDCSQGGPTVDFSRQSETGFLLKEVAAQIESMHTEGNNMQVDEDRHETLLEHFSKLSCEELAAASTVGESQPMLCSSSNLDSMAAHDERNLSSDEQSQKAHMLQDNQVESVVFVR